jgi:hypothetical protein
MISMKCCSALFALAATLVCSLPIFAQKTEALCDGFGEPLPELQMGAVATSERRVYFVLNGHSNTPTCPNETNSCQDKPYVVRGDLLLMRQNLRDFVCVTYFNEKGYGHSGWLPKKAVSVVAPQTSFDIKNWHGRWSAPEKTISIQRGTSSNTLRLDGQATFGAFDAERVKRGAVNIGEFEAVTRPQGDSLAFTMKDGQALPYSRQMETECSVQLRRYGELLIAQDNQQCGGLNVSFSAVYRREP